MTDAARADRMRGAIIGQITGDALCLGSHWYYDLAEIARLFPAGIRGFEAPLPGHYHAGKRPGELTHYGDAALVLLRSVAEAGGLDPVHYGRRYVAAFAPEVYQGYRDKPTRGMFDHWQAFTRDHPGQPYDFQDGADDAQNVGTSRLAPVVVRHAGDPMLDRLVEQAVRVCQNNDLAVAYAQVHAHLLRRLLAGEPLAAVLARVIGEAGDGPVPPLLAQRYQEAQGLLDRPVAEVTGRFGRSCALESAFPSCLHVALQPGIGFADGVLATAAAGGDNASRAALLGSWLGAAQGAAAIPTAWIERLAAREAISGLTERVIEAAA